MTLVEKLIVNSQAYNSIITFMATYWFLPFVGFGLCILFAYLAMKFNKWQFLIGVAISSVLPAFGIQILTLEIQHSDKIVRTILQEIIPSLFAIGLTLGAFATYSKYNKKEKIVIGE
jgi:magnesium-transporting ATPase (P-type)